LRVDVGAPGRGRVEAECGAVDENECGRCGEDEYDVCVEAVSL